MVQAIVNNAVVWGVPYFLDWDYIFYRCMIKQNFFFIFTYIVAIN